MRVLWVSSSNTFYNQTDAGSSNSSYNGVGWVGAQQIEIMKQPDIELAVMFLSNKSTDKKRIIDGVSYYPIIESVSKLTRVKRFYFPPKSSVFNRVKKQIDLAIRDFKPDIIQVYGLECPICEIITHYEIPSIVHLQGILNPYSISYLPPMISEQTLRKYGCWWREHIFNNGFRFYYKDIIRRCERERQLYSKLKYCTGRTHWDKAVTSLYSPDCKYYHVDEVLRPEFYTSLPVSPRNTITSIKIMSTISETVYKGLDLVVQSSQLLQDLDIDFEWHVVGVKPNSNYVKLIERTLNRKIPQNIFFEGVKAPKEMIELLHKTDVYVHPSYIDNSPNSVCEAQILGVPVIATNVGGVSSLITDTYSGLLVPTNEPHILAYRIIDIKDKFDLRNLLSVNGRSEALKRHDKKKIISDIVEIYKKIAK